MTGSVHKAGWGRFLPSHLGFRGKRSTNPAGPTLWHTCARSVASVVSDSLRPYGLQPLSVEFSRQEYCSGLPFPPLGDLPNPGIKLESLSVSCVAGRFFTAKPLGKPSMAHILCYLSWPKSPQILLFLYQENCPSDQVLGLEGPEPLCMSYTPMLLFLSTWCFFCPFHGLLLLPSH